MFKRAHANWVSRIVRYRTTLVIAICLSASVAALIFGSRSRAEMPLMTKLAAPNSMEPTTPTSGNTLTDSSGPLTFTGGPYAVPNPSSQASGKPTCNAALPCDEYSFTVNVSNGTSMNKYVRVELAWPVVGEAQFDLYVFDGTTASGKIIAQSLGDATYVMPDVCLIPALPATNGTYTLRIVPFLPLGQSVTGKVSLVDIPAAAPSDTGAAPSFSNHDSPSTLGNSSGEPSIGVDWNPNAAEFKHGNVNTGGVAFLSANGDSFPGAALEARVSFDDSTTPATATWEDVSAVYVQQTGLVDPIGWVDHQTGRVFQLELVGGQGNSTAAYSDNDGKSWTPMQGGGLPAGPDHETFGGGPYNNGSVPPPPPHPLYPNALYYCSQNIVGGAECSRSDDGGLTFGPGIDIFPPTQCYGGIHGHVKVAPDGTVYVPNSSCTSGTGGSQGVAVSTDNGLTWIDRTVPTSTGSGDPSIGIDANNKVYIGYVNADGRPHIAISTDHGQTWTKDYDVGIPADCNASADPNPQYAQCRLKSAVFPVVVAGDPGRAAFGFLGSTTGGNYQDQATYQGVWYFYVAMTYDGGNTWTTVNATSGDPVQKGSICLGGLTCGTDRNLLDFNDMTVDREGRVLAAYADGCVAPGCAALNYSGRDSKAAMIRQAGGRRLFAAFDPNSSPTPTPTPTPTPSAFGPRLLHFHGNPDDTGGGVPCAGSAPADIETCGGPFLKPDTTLFSGPAAIWNSNSSLNDAVERSPVDPNWVWNLGGSSTTLRGDMALQFWAICGACVPGTFNAKWDISLWADGNKQFTQRIVGPTPATPNLPSLLTATVNIPSNITATNRFVLVIDPVFIDTQENTKIYYDSTLPCPGATSGPCDSTATMPVVDPSVVPTPTPTPTPIPTPAPPGPGTPRFQIYVPSSSFSGGEPSIGADWKTGNAMYLASFNPIRIGFDDCSSPAKDTWTNTSIPSAVSLDPILFTDHNLPPGTPNRTFVSQLTGQDSITFFTDNDGASYSPSQGGGIPSGVDHQTVGAGPYKPNTTPSASPRSSYPNAVYYCSQDAATAFCARSDDGGQTFGVGVPIYEVLQCTGIHGHVKVAPDGTVYVPNRSCGGKASVVVSNDNGVTWTVRPAPASSTTGFLVDPSVGIGTNNVGKPSGQASNTIYLGYQASDGHPRIAVSHDQGANWINDQDVGTFLGIRNSTFPEVVAGDDNRAAYAFLGTTVSGDYTNQATYDQSAPWHLYIATTFDGGATWSTTDATPNDPVQRGSICNLGTTSCNGHNPNDRNLLDFMDATIDAQGRTLVAYPDGCVGSCVKKPSGTHPNSYTSRASIARQSGGQRLFAAFDPAEPNLPGAPKARAEISDRGGPTVVSWPAADDSGAPISSYKVYRRDGANGSFNLIATVTDTTYSDNTFTAPATSNAYRVTAVNGLGESPNCGDIVPVVVTFESSCLYPYIQVGDEGVPGAVPTDPTNGELTIQRLNVGEPFSSCGDNSLTLIMKVNTLDPQNTGTAVLPPNSEWQVLFGITDTAGNAQKAYVAVDTFSPNTPATPRISIGRRDPTATGTLDSRVCTNDLTNTCPAISANFNKDGTIVLKLNLATPINFSAPGTGATGTAFTWDGSTVGTTIGTAQVITGTTYVLAGAGAGLLESVQTTSGEDYTRIGNTACGTGVPNASLTANPTSGNVPLTVSFNASASSVPQSCNTIASYTLDFGDGSSTATQSTPTFSHTYNNAGDYTARLTVTDSAGRTSTNDSHALIHVTSPAPSPSPTPTPGPKTIGTGGPVSPWDGTWNGALVSPGGVTEEDTCVDGVNCETFTFTVGGTKADWIAANERVQVKLSWQSSSNEYDIYIHKGSDINGPLVTSSIQGPGLTHQVAFIDVSQWGTGVFTVHAAYDVTATSATDPYRGSVSAVPQTFPMAPAAIQDNGPKIGYENFEAPGVLTPVTTTSAGGQVHSFEYMGRGAGEPSIGNNWKTGVTSFQSDLQTLFITFNDTTHTATWVNRAAPTSQAVDSDPIGFTDPLTGRTFAGELTLLSPDTCKTSYTDDDGKTWIPSQGSGIGSGVDHETIGGGPFHAPLTRPTGVPGVYANAVYYCSQDIATAFCSRSDDGGLTFGASVPLYTLTTCVGIHGHVKVAPDGTVYVPNNSCNSGVNSVGSVVVSTDNGNTWNVQPVRNSSWVTSPGSADPAVAIDAAGRVYFAIANTDNSIAVGTSDNQGQTWNNIVDVGGSYNLKNIRYPAAVAGDAGRAAVAFYGSTTSGDANSGSFNGVWHLYIAHTFDGGSTWTTTDATPNAPMQRGNIWTNGGANIGRNLLDFFDMTIDSQGRIEVGYVNGCSGGPCAQSSATASGNAYTATATIARQSSGRRMFARFDPTTTTTAPGMPTVTTRRVGNVVHLGWSEADTGNSAITGYKIMRGISSGGETLLTTVPGNQTLYDDTTATDTTKTYYYKVLAVNGVGTSYGANEVSAPYMGDTCNGLIIHKNDPTHPEANAGTATPASLLIDYISVAEPPGTNNLMFKMKVNDLSTVPPNSRWRITWDSFSAQTAVDPTKVVASAQQYYVGMTTGASGAPTFEFGTLKDAGVPAILVISETKIGAALSGSGFSPDGTITIIIPKSAVGNPQPGDLLGAIGGRTITGDTPGTNTLERSNLFIDHTFVKAQTDSSYPVATYTVNGNTNCSQFIEQNVNSLVSLQLNNPGSASGVSSFDLALKNTSTQTIFVPLRIEVAQLTSASGKVTVKNADNSGTGTGAAWDYSSYVGSDNILSAAEVSLPRTLKFNNPNNEAFTVTFNVIGNLANPGNSSSSSSGSSSSGGGSSGSSSTTGPTTTVTNAVYQVTYNPLLNKLTVLLK